MLLISFRDIDSSELLSTVYSPLVPETWETVVIMLGRLRKKPLRTKYTVERREWHIHDSGSSKTQFTCILYLKKIEEEVVKPIIEIEPLIGESEQVKENIND